MRRPSWSRCRPTSSWLPGCRSLTLCPRSARRPEPMWWRWPGRSRETSGSAAASSPRASATTRDACPRTSVPSPRSLLSWASARWRRCWHRGGCHPYALPGRARSSWPGNSRAARWPGRRVGALGVAFKPGSDDVRNSASLDVCDRLTAEGVSGTVDDPVATGSAALVRPDLALRRVGRGGGRRRGPDRAPHRLGGVPAARPARLGAAVARRNVMTPGPPSTAAVAVSRRAIHALGSP